MTRKKNKHKRQSYKKILVDNSVQIERIKYPEDVQQELDSLSNEYHFFTSHFAIHEFKVGFVFSLIQYYFLVDISPKPSDAIMIWSEKYGREPKYGLIMQGQIQRINESVEPAKDKATYLKRLELIILDVLATFENRIEGNVGDFVSDAIVKYPITDKDSYEGFSQLIKSRKTMIPMTSFWQKNSTHLDAILASEQVKKELPKIHKRLEKIKAQFSKADTTQINRGIGDAVIAVDSPKEYLILAYDSSFSFLCPCLKKEYKILEKKPKLPLLEKLLLAKL